MHSGQLGVSNASYIVYAKELKDVVYACHHFDIRFVFVHYVRTFWELKQQRIVGVLLQERVVLVGKCTPHALHRDVFAPLQTVDERQTVKHLAAAGPRY